MNVYQAREYHPTVLNNPRQVRVGLVDVAGYVTRGSRENVTKAPTLGQKQENFACSLQRGFRGPIPPEFLGIRKTRIREEGEYS